MNMTLTRTDYLSTGIFGKLESEDGSLSLCTLEHAYTSAPDVSMLSTHFEPKIPGGTFVCRRGLHQLHEMAMPFETFEIMKVPGHKNILFHSGNWQRDSEGCVLLGLARQGDSIIHSKEAFDLFMTKQLGQDFFQLTVC